MGIRKYNIFDKDKENKKRKILWFPILKRGIKDGFKKKFSKLLFAFSAIPFISFIIPLYVSAKPELKFLLRKVKFLSNDASFFYSFFTNNFLIFILLLLSVFIGAELISKDFKTNAIPLYFARPITKSDYIKGKISILLFYLLAFTLVPGILLILFKFIFTGNFPNSRILLSAVVYPVLIGLFFSAYTLLLSSLSNNEKFVKIAIFFIYILSDIIFGILKNILKSKYFGLISIRVNLKNFAASLFNTQSDFGFSGWYSGLILLLISSLFIFILYRRVERTGE